MRRQTQGVSRNKPGLDGLRHELGLPNNGKKPGLFFVCLFLSKIQ